MFKGFLKRDICARQYRIIWSDSLADAVKGRYVFSWGERGEGWGLRGEGHQ